MPVTTLMCAAGIAGQLNPFFESTGKPVPKVLRQEVEQTLNLALPFQAQYTRWGIPFFVAPPAPCSCNLKTVFVCVDNAEANVPSPHPPVDCPPNAGCGPGQTAVGVDCGAKAAGKARKLFTTTSRLEYNWTMANCGLSLKSLSEQGLSLFANNEMGEATSEVVWHFSRQESKTPDAKDKICTALKKAKEYFVAKKQSAKPSDLPRVEHVSMSSEARAVWPIFDGHHAGNYRGFAIRFRFEGQAWKVRGFDFPFDHTP